MGLENLVISTSPLTGRIYAGYLSKDGKKFRDKIDITEQVYPAISHHLDKQGIVVISEAGTLKFEKTEVPHD